MQTVNFYDRWVNGAGLRLAQLVLGQSPAKQAPEPSPVIPAIPQPTTIGLQRYEREPQLPALDRDALLPITHVLVHGSMATGDACAFSDIDIAVIVDDLRAFPAEQHRAAVLELRRLLHCALSYDPLMHHGLMFFPASGLAQYDQRFLPLETLRHARVLHGPAALDLTLRNAPDTTFTQSLNGCAASLQKHVRERSFLQSDYRLKNFLSGVLLMPARILAARGIHVYKRDSFNIARELFEKADWEFVARCEGLRAFWKRPPEPLAHRYIPNRCHPRLLEIVGARMSPTMNAHRLSKAMIQGLLRSAERFFNRLEALA